MYYGYARVSTQTQAEKGYGLDAQIDMIEKHVLTLNGSLTKTFVDAGISGNLADTDDDDAILKRTGLMELLSTVEENDCVVVANTSRMWRSDMTKAIVRRELMKRKVNLISVEQPKYNLYNKDPNEYLINSMMELLDCYERMSISLKLARGRTTKALGGDKPSGVCPFGYKYSDDRKHVVIDESEAAIVKQLFTEGQKGLSLRKIANEMNQRGYKTRSGHEWSSGNVQVILRNRFYIGELQHQGKPIPGNHEPIISRVQFGKVAAQLKERRK